MPRSFVWYICLSLLSVTLSVLYQPALFWRDPPFSRVVAETDRVVDIERLPAAARWFIARYKINGDTPQYVNLALDFPGEFSRDLTRVSRPGYSVLLRIIASPVFVFTQDVTIRYAAIFGAGLVLNTLLIFLTLRAFDDLLRRLGATNSVAFWSSFLFVFSPHVRTYAGQLVPEITTDAIVVVGLWCIVAVPRDVLPAGRQVLRRGLLAFAYGVLMLIKPIFLAVFAAGLGTIVRERLRSIPTLIAVALGVALPLLAWRLIVTDVLHLTWYVHEISQYGQGIWFLSQPLATTFRETLTLFWQAKLGSFVPFSYVLPPLAVAGFFYAIVRRPATRLPIVIFLISYAAALILFRSAQPRFVFLAFPLVLPLAVTALDVIARHLPLKFQTVFVPLSCLLIAAIALAPTYPGL